MARRAEKVFYLDSSAVAKIYLKEQGWEELQDLIGVREDGFREEIEVCVSRLAFPETLSAVKKQEKAGTITKSAAVGMWNQIVEDFLFPPSPYVIYEPSEAVIGYAAFIVAHHGLRAYDAVHLSTANRIRATLAADADLVFLSSDRRLNNVAREERFVVTDPEALAQARAPEPE